MISNSFCLKTGKWAMTVWFTQLPDLLLTPLFCIGCSWQNQSTSLHWKSNLFLWRGIPNFISFPIFIVKCGLWYEARPEGPGPNTQAGDAEHTSEWQKIKYSVWESKVPPHTHKVYRNGGKTEVYLRLRSYTKIKGKAYGGQSSSTDTVSSWY